MAKLLKTGWYVLYVRSRYERKVDELLRENGVESFVPLITKIRQWSDRKKMLVTPLFSSYVFVHIKSSMDFHKTLSTEGASAFIRFGNEYGIVSDEEIKKIKFLVGAKDLKDVKIEHQSYAIGEIREIQYGALAGLQCEIFKVNNENKVIVRLDSIQQNIVATIPSGSLVNLDKIA